MVHYYYYERQNENMNSITSYLKKKHYSEHKILTKLYFMHKQKIYTKYLFKFLIYIYI